VGLADFFRRRRSRESAIAPEVLAGLREGGDRAAPGGSRTAGERRGDAGAGSAVDGESITLPGADAGELGAMIARAISSGNAEISTESHTVDMRGSGLRDEILGLLQGHGIDSGSGTEVNLSGDEGAGAELLELLRQHGLEIDRPDQGGADPPSRG
jgi:hypothetical protein